MNGFISFLVGLGIGGFIGFYLYTRKKQEVIQLQERLKLKEQNSEHFKDLAKNIAQEVLEDRGRKLNQDFKTIISPLDNLIKEFKFQLKEETKGRQTLEASLGTEIKNIIRTNLEVKKQTDSLTKALEGDVRAQGVWGEIILEKLLENSGLKEGVEYTLQGKGMKIKDEGGKTQKPDVIVQLPDHKTIVIDSKVSLVHYKRFIDTEDKKENLNQFIKSIESHIKTLSDKSYHHQLEKNPDFTLMFFPIEGAFSLALQENPDLFSRAWNKSIIIVSPTTLLATLRTVAAIWKQKKQNDNASRIAQESGKLYDKFVGFLEDMQDIKIQLSKSEKSYSKAMGKLQDGPGNIIKKLENIKELGAKNSKNISSHSLEQ